jgi:hypothetical protein
MITVCNARRTQTLSPLAYPGDGKPPQPGKIDYWQVYFVSHQLLAAGCNSKRILFLKEPSGNV